MCMGGPQTPGGDERDYIRYTNDKTIIAHAMTVGGHTGLAGQLAPLSVPLLLLGPWCVPRRAVRLRYRLRRSRLLPSISGTGLSATSATGALPCRFI